MRKHVLHVTLWSTALISLAPTADGPSGPDRPAKAALFFETNIRPILAGTCVKCHGEKKTRGGLRLDSRAALLQGGDSGPAVIPGDPDQSLLIQAIRQSHQEIKMPPNRRLPDEVVKDFVTWVKDGAAWSGERVASDEPLTPTPLPRGERGRGEGVRRPWSFAPLRQTTPPADPSGWSEDPIDQFLRARQRDQGLVPASPADRRKLLRRVTFDLVGLPPTPADVEAFLADRSPEAWAKVVDRLLASPQYGERWGRHWLDVARYADTGGFEADPLYPGAWRYRDYVIRSLNADKPFDRFIQEQVAGDELWPDDREAVLGTGLYCIGPTLEESAMLSNQLEHEWLTDAVDTTGAAFLGLTLGCARCHDHKYDPITQQDFYAMQAIFAASDRPYSGKVRLLRIKGLNGLLSEAPVPEQLKNDPRCTLRTEDKVGFHLFHREQPMEVHRLHRGELGKPREVVAAAIPVALLASSRSGEPSRTDAWGAARLAAPTESGKRRAALAYWLTADDNPLTARVLINRVWGWHFGQPLVRTPNDFGRQGEPPAQPELLDWLARDFMEHGWSLKRLHRRILLSATYRMQSIAEGPGIEADPENRLLWHFPRHRLEGEAIRDSMLACAGTLNPKLFGPAVVPPLSRQELAGLFDANGKWPVTKDASQHTRRSIYVLVRRTFPYPLFAAFDPPEVMTSCPCRRPTVVPTQALTLLNSPLAREQSTAFAQRLRKECGDDPEQLVARAWLLAFGRPVSPAERERAIAFLKKRPDALADLCLALFNTNEFIYVD
jgi:hypothetical protein